LNVQEQLLRDRIDPHLTPENLSELASAALGENAEVVGHSVLSGGCWNRVIAVTLRTSNQEIVIKISPAENDMRLRREFSVLEYFAIHTSMPVPKPLYVDLSGRTIPGSLIIMEKIPGKVMHGMIAYLSDRDRKTVTDRIAGHVVELHKHTATGFGGVELTDQQRHESWPDFWLPRFDRVIDEVEASNVVSEQMLDDIRKVRPHFPSLLDIGRTGVLTHYDIWSGNVMIDTKEGDPYISGFLDVPGFIADYARELSFMMMFGVADDRFFETYQEQYRIDEQFSLRVSIYNLKMHLKHITMYPSQSYYRQGAADCLDFIQQYLR
jgi:fructosamine-3-kinase